MPDGIKFSTTVQTSSLQKGNVAIGIGNVGPTSTTDFYSVPVPVSGKYIVSKVSASGFPLFFSPADEAEMIKLAKQEGATGANTASLASCLNYFATQTNYSVANLDYEDIVTSGSLLTLDAGFTTSYPTTGSTWYDLSGNSYNGTLTNGPTFNSGSNGSIVFDGTDDYVITSNTTYNFSTNANFTYCAWIYPSFSSSSSTGRAVINSTSPSNAIIRAYLRWEGPSLGFYFDMVTSAWYTTSTTFNANTWHYLCFTHNSSNSGSYYFDGTAVTTVSNPGGLATITNNPITIGYGSINSYYWSGRISNVQIYNRALTASEVLQNYNAQKGRYLEDADYTAFYNRVIAAGGSLTSTEQSATLQLVLDLKSIGVWTAMKAIYPMVGASAAACAQNLKSSSFTGTFTSGWTFASTGAKPNGTGAYMNTGLVPSGNLSQNNASISYYSRTNYTATTEFEMGVDSGQSIIYLVIYAGGSSFGNINAFGDVSATSSSNTQAFYQVIRNNGTQYNWFRNGTKSVASQNSSTNLATGAIYIGASNGAGLYTRKECAFSSIGDGLTDTQATNYYTAVQAFNTTLSRQV
jgi:hypothetical protein